jgi:uncharacterized protein (TIGR02265 family)
MSTENIQNAVPTTRGMFVKSHCDALRKKNGAEGVAELEKRYGKPICFEYFDNVPIREEIKIIEYSLDILHPEGFSSPTERVFEAGRLHFRNFTTTAFAKLLFYSLPKDFKMFMLKTKYIAPRIFQHVRFESANAGENSVRVTMYNNDYPLEHFQGFFYEWMLFFGLSGQVEAKKRGDNAYEYTMIWK